MLEVDESNGEDIINNKIMNKVIINFNIFCACVKNPINSHISDTNIVIVYKRVVEK